MPISRRAFVGSLAAGTAFLGTAGLAGRAVGQETQPLRVPPLIDATAGEPVGLRVQPGTTSFYPGRSSATLGYNGGYLGPTLRVRRGDAVEVAVRNELDEPTTVHWHGMLIPGDVDGGPHQSIRPGETWRPTLEISQPAATLWYHPHPHRRTAEQVYRGLAGFLIVTDEEEQALGLPSEYGVDDIPLVFQDRSFRDGRLVMPDGMMTIMQGRRGDTVLTNGTVNARAEVPARLVRLRLLNGANARIFDVSFSDDRPFHWIAADGGLLDAPVEMTSLRLAPGERAEILVDFSDGAEVSLLTPADDGNAPMMMGMRNRFEQGVRTLLGGGGETLVRFAPAADGVADASVPGRLVARSDGRFVEPTRRRRFVLTMGMGGMMGGGSGRGMMNGGGMMGMRGGGMLGINGESFDMDRIDERVPLGATEVWEVSGEMMSHPFHVHGVQFEILSRGGRPPEQRDKGMRDTVLVDDPVELLVRFNQPSGDTPFMYHCHILEHEDNGMMGQFVTTA